MMSDLRNFLSEYKNLTLKAIESINDPEMLNQVLAQRQLLIDEINKLDYEKNEFIAIAGEFDLLASDKELKNKVQDERNETKKALNNVRKLRQARKSYNSIEGTPKFISETK
jgi:hypothetical protein